MTINSFLKVILAAFFFLFTLNIFSQDFREIQKQNARATGYAIIASKNPNVRFSVLVIPWDKQKTLEENANIQINSSWHAQCAIKGNFFDQVFDGSNFTNYSSVVTSQEEFDLYKNTGSEWWIACSTLPAFSSGIGESFSKEHTITDYSPLLKLKRSTDQGGYIQGIQTQLKNGISNWFFGNLHADKWIVSKGDFQNAKLAVLENGNVGIGTDNPLSKLDVFGDISLNYQHGASPIFRAPFGSPDAGAIDFGNGTGWKFHIRRRNDNAKLITFIDNGSMGLGTESPTEKLDVRGDIKFGSILRTDKRMHITGGESLYLLNKGGVIISKSWQGNGNLNVEGNTVLSGNVGIGLSNPLGKFHVGDDTTSGIILNNKIGSVVSQIPAQIAWAESGNLGQAGDLIISPRTDISGSVKFFTYNGKDIAERFKISGKGDASLQGKLEAKELKITTTPTADFVFAENYNLPKLEEVEKHLKEKKHLPEIASAKEMEKEGVNVGEFQIKLLQKIEELTLYVIEQNKKIKELETRLKSN
uniref:hypothetical protein n=1 Tax=Flavobacterium davisii TaxID=2906077 RepID=UPI00157CE264|nr:hypothetical protein [Flavobacterium davisii]